MVTLSAIGTVIGFMLPWISFEVEGIRIGITAFDIIRVSGSFSKISPITDMIFKNADYSRFSLLALPLLGVLTLTVNSLRGPVGIYFLCGIIAAGFFIHLLVNIYPEIHKAVEFMKESQKLMNQLNIPAGKMKFPVTFTGAGVYVSTASILGVLAGSIMELLPKKR